MEAIITAITVAFSGLGSAFVNGFSAITQIFYVNDELTFIGGLLIVGVVAMFIMMLLSWVISLVRRI